MTRVLVIDDDSDIRRLIVFALSDESFQVDEASDGNTALALLDPQHPDIILLDMKMAGMDGWDFMRRYRELYNHRAPIIVITAAPDPAQRRADVDADSYISKPFELSDLVERVTAIARSVDKG
jgi:two-component system OmpR family response regulator